MSARTPFTRTERGYGSRRVRRFAFMATLLGMAACANDPVALDLVLCENGTGPECVDGSLSLSVSGLPDELNASVIIRGPNGFRITASSSQTFQVLAGEYTVEALPVESVTTSYNPETPLQTVLVSGQVEVAIKYVEATAAS